MKKINKSNPPNALTEYAKANPKASWDDFRDENAGKSYRAVKDLLLLDQGGICGYCERKIQDLPPRLQRIEHYHDKSDRSGFNWALEWSNLISVCSGGDDAGGVFPLPQNLSCDSYKNHLVVKNKLEAACEGYFLNPLRIVTISCLFTFDKSSGKIGVDFTACESLDDIDNKYDSLSELVEHTISILNLNCDRLCMDRLEVLKNYNQLVKKYRIRGGKNFKSEIARRWFSGRWPSFFTTRRVLLGQDAEKYFEEISYIG